MIVEAARRLVREGRELVWGPNGCVFCQAGKNPHGGGKVHGPLCPWVDLVDAVEGTFGEIEAPARAVGDIEPVSPPEQAA